MKSMKHPEAVESQNDDSILPTIKNIKVELKHYTFPKKKDLNNLNEIAKKDFGYGEHTHFLDFLNQEKSKWGVIFKHVLPQDQVQKEPNNEKDTDKDTEFKEMNPKKVREPRKKKSNPFTGITRHKTIMVSRQPTLRHSFVLKEGPFEDVKELTEEKFSFTDDKSSSASDINFSEMSGDSIGSQKHAEPNSATYQVKTPKYTSLIKSANSITQRLKEGNKLLKNIQLGKRNEQKSLSKVNEFGKESSLTSYHSRLSKTSNCLNTQEIIDQLPESPQKRRRDTLPVSQILGSVLSRNKEKELPFSDPVTRNRSKTINKAPNLSILTSKVLNNRGETMNNSSFINESLKNICESSNVPNLSKNQMEKIKEFSITKKKRLSVVSTQITLTGTSGRCLSPTNKFKHLKFPPAIPDPESTKRFLEGSFDSEQQPKISGQPLLKGKQDWYIKNKIDFIRKKLISISEHPKFKANTHKGNTVLNLISNLQDYDVESISMKELTTFHMMQPFVKYIKVLKKYFKTTSLKEKNKLMMEFSELEIKMIIPKRVRNASIVLDSSSTRNSNRFHHVRRSIDNYEKFKDLPQGYLYQSSFMKV